MGYVVIVLASSALVLAWWLAWVFHLRQRRASPAPFPWLKVGLAFFAAAAGGLSAFIVFPPTDDPGPVPSRFEITFPTPEEIYYETCEAAASVGPGAICAHEIRNRPPDLLNRPKLQFLTFIESHDPDRGSVELQLEVDVGPYPERPQPLPVAISLPFGGEQPKCEQVSSPAQSHSPEPEFGSGRLAEYYERQAAREEPPTTLDCWINRYRSSAAYLSPSRLPAALHIAGFQPDANGIGAVKVSLHIPSGDRQGVGWRQSHSRVLVNMPECGDSALLPEMSNSRLIARGVPSELLVDPEWDPVMTVYYHIPETGFYDWPDPEPDLSDLPRQDIPYGGASWSYRCQHSGDVPEPLSAAKDGVAQQDSVQLFFAGALAALAATAAFEFLAALAGWTDKLRSPDNNGT